jgi:GH3 auxin-responsive promoter
MNPAGWLNTTWMLGSAGEARAFRRATRRVARTQAAVLAAIVRANRNTAFGRVHDLRRIDGPRAYQRLVPLSTYDDYSGCVDRIAGGEAGVLTAERIERLVPTGGSTGGEKLIPYTATLRRQFQRAVAAWVHDLFHQRPAVRRGRAYWSISPAFGPPRHTAGGVPVGFDDDAAYLGPLTRLALGRLLVVPAAAARLPDLEAFRYCTLLCLLAAADLALVSVWNPTFLTALLAPVEGWADRLCGDLAAGTVSPPGPLPPGLLGPFVRRDRRRAAELTAVFHQHLPLPETLRLVWPRLALISCWADAAAARCLGELTELFPAVEVQPKGLLATEGCVSFPLLGRPGAVLAVRSHFFEFREADGAHCRLAHELELGGRYRVVLTTGGGLYRYQLLDEIEVVGFENECPLLRFLGKADRVSDLVGEKLAESHVRAVLERLFTEHGLAPRFAMVVPVPRRPACYRLYVQGPPPDLDPAPLADGLDAGLRENPHYAYAVGLGQLAPAEVAVLDPGGEPAAQVYLRRGVARGQRPGDVKPAALDPRLDWPAEFRSLEVGVSAAQRA